MSGRGGQITSGAADQRSLPLGGMQKPEAILKSLPVPDLRFEAQRLMIERELKLHLGDLSNFDAAGNGGAHAAFAQVFVRPSNTSLPRITMRISRRNLGKARGVLHGCSFSALGITLSHIITSASLPGRY